MTILRPWGHLDWLLGKVGGADWSLLGCLGTEERSTAVPHHLGRQSFERARLVTIREPQPLDSEAIAARLQNRRNALHERDYGDGDFRDADLLADLDEVRSNLLELLDAGARKLIIDITSLPTIWFFPLIQLALEEARLTDIIVTYTSAIGYAEVLSENSGPLRPLPGFFVEDGRSQHDSIVVGIGFEPLGLVPLLQDQRASKIRLIFPFPPGPPGHHRNWMFVKQIETLTQSEQIDPPDRVHIHMYDCPQVFDALCDMTAVGTETSLLAPYGPKTVSLAMCLFSLAAASADRPRVPVLYAQPLRYAIDYTTGIKMRGDVPDITAYSIRMNGRNLYAFPV